MERRRGNLQLTGLLGKSSRVASCIRGLNFRNGISHLLSITNEFFIKSLSHRHWPFTPRTMTVEENLASDQLFPPPIPVPPLSIAFPSLAKIGRAGTSWAAEERLRMGFSPLRRPRRRVQNRQDVCVNYRFFTPAFGDGYDCLVFPTRLFSRLDGEFFKNQTGKDIWRYVYYYLDIRLTCSSRVTRLRWARSLWFWCLAIMRGPLTPSLPLYLHRHLPPFTILCANISFYNLAWDTSSLQITSAIQSAWNNWERLSMRSIILAEPSALLGEPTLPSSEYPNHPSIKILRSHSPVNPL